MSRKAFVAGVGMIPFTKPGKSDDYDVMGAGAATAALEDAGLEYSKVQQAYVGYVYGDSTSGQRALYNLGETGIPVINVNNNCATGSTALWLARQAVESGAVECALALGFEQMQPGALKGAWTDRPRPLGRFDEVLEAAAGIDASVPRAAQYFGVAGMEYMEKFGMKAETFAKIQVRHASTRPTTRTRCSAHNSPKKKCWQRRRSSDPSRGIRPAHPRVAPRQRSSAPKSSPAPTDFVQTSRSRRSR